MYYRPRERRRHPFITFLLWISLLALTVVLVLMLGIYVGYIDYEPPALAQQFQPTPTPTRPTELYMADADTYWAEGNLRQAIEAYEQAIHINPANDVPYMRQAHLLIYTRETAKAVARAEQAVLRKPDSADNLAAYCRALDWEARYTEAYDACACALELEPDHADAYAFLSEVYADQGDWISARESAQQAIEANFQSMHAHHNMGYALEIQGRYAEAVEFYENAITLAPNLAPLYVDAGQSYYWLGQYEKAGDHFKRAIKLNPTDPAAYNWLGWTYYTNGEFTQAIDALEQSISVDPTFISNSRGTSSWGNLATVYYARQNFEEVVQLLPKAVELAESEFLRRARRVELFAQVQTLTGVESIPLMRGEFIELTNRARLTDTARLEPIRYLPSFVPETEQSCVSSILQNIRNEALLVRTTRPLTLTQVISDTAGLATLDLTSGMMTVDIKNLPRHNTPYELRLSFWPGRTDSVGMVEPDPQGNVFVRIQFDEKVLAPIEYYYTLGLAYAYLEPPNCTEAIPWLLKAVEMDSSAFNPAWDGLKPSRCPTSNSPPTPIPTATPMPEEE